MVASSKSEDCRCACIKFQVFGFLLYKLKSSQVDSMGGAQKMTVSERKLLSICEDMDCEYLMKQSEAHSQGSIKKTSILPWNIMKSHLVELVKWHLFISR